MSDWIDRTPRIVWGDAYDKALDFGGPLDNPEAYDLPGEGSEQARTPARAVDAWLRPRMYFLEGDARFVPGVRSLATGVPATGWYDEDGWAAFLRWAQDANVFYFHPDSRNLAQSPELSTDTDLDGVADDWLETTGNEANITGEDALMDGTRQKVMFTGSTGAGWIQVYQNLYGVIEGEFISGSVEVEVTGLTGTARVLLVTRFRDAGGTSLQANSTIISANQAATRVTFASTAAPAGTAYAEIAMRADAQGSGDAVNAWFKEITVNRGSTPEEEFIENTRWEAYLLEPFADKPFTLEEDATVMTHLKMLFADEVDLNGYVNTP